MVYYEYWPDHPEHHEPYVLLGWNGREFISRPWYAVAEHDLIWLALQLKNALEDSVWSNNRMPMNAYEAQRWAFGKSNYRNPLSSYRCDEGRNPPVAVQISDARTVSDLFPGLITYQKFYNHGAWIRIEVYGLYNEVIYSFEIHQGPKI